MDDSYKPVLSDAIMERRRQAQDEKLKKGPTTTSFADTLFRKRREREAEINALYDAEK